MASPRLEVAVSGYREHQMTMLVAIGTPHETILVADRRLTVAGRPVDDDADKVLGLAVDDARVGVAFTGLAKIIGFSTYSWVIEELCRITAEVHDLERVLERLQEAATARWRQFKLRRDQRFCEFLVAGYHQQDDRAVMVEATLTYRDRDRAFDLQLTHAPPPAYAVTAGSVELSKREMERLCTLAIDPKWNEDRALRQRHAATEDVAYLPKVEDALAQATIGAMRNAAAAHRIGTTVGSHCTALYLRPSPSLEFRVRDDADRDEFQAMSFPAIVVGIAGQQQLIPAGRVEFSRAFPLAVPQKARRRRQVRQQRRR